MKKNKPFGELFYRSLKKTLLTMRIAVILMIIGILQARANDAYSQKTRLSVNFTETELAKVLDKIEVESEFFFLYNEKLLDIDRKISINEKDQLISVILNDLFAGTNIKYDIVDRKIILAPDYLTSAPLPQQGKITGAVTDKSGTPLPGVNVVVTGTTKGVTTDAAGKYSIEVPQGSKSLTFTFVGMQPQEINIGTLTQINVTMAESAVGLEEVIVIGYGTIKKKDLTGAVTNLNTKDLQAEATSNVTSMLRGSIPGLSVSFNTTPKGLSSSSDMLVRGQTSLRALDANGTDNPQKAANAPLVVVDGMIYYGDLADINPVDIESFDVLKDASSAAIYGSRASNGVILITTKKGTKGKPIINVSTSTGLAYTSPSHYDLMDGKQFIARRIAGFEANERHQITMPGYYQSYNNLPSGVILDQWKAYDGSTAATDLDVVWLNRIGFSPTEMSNYKAGKETDFSKYTWQKGLTQDYNMSVSGSSDAISYYMSLGYTNNEGIKYNESFNTIRSRINLEANITNWLKVGTNTQIAFRDESPIPINVYLNQGPYSQMYEADGKTLMYSPSGYGPNFWYDMTYHHRFIKYNTLNSKIYGLLTLPFGFTFTSEFIPRFNWNRDYESWSSKEPDWALLGGQASRQNTTIFEWQLNNILKWNKTFGIHAFDVTLLQNAEKYQYWEDYMYRQQFLPSDVLGYHRMQAASQDLNISSDDQVSTGDALMARLNYTLMSRYNFTASFRRDGYSAFGQSNPRANFWSVAGGWTISKENFFKVSWIEMLKLRVSYGTNGNRGVGIYDALSDLTTGKLVLVTNGVPGYVSLLSTDRMANSGLQWERTSAYNTGLDFSIFKDRLGGSVDAYYKITKNLLIPRQLPDITAYTSVFSNLGQVDNKGFEIVLNSKNIVKQDFTWTSDFSLAFNRNKIVHLYGDFVTDSVTGARKEVDDITNKWFIGHAVDQIWDYKTQGIWQTSEATEATKYGRSPGDYKLQDVNGDGYYTNADKQFQGYQTPPFRLTLRNTIQYKNWDLSIKMYSYLGYFKADNWLLNASAHYDRSTYYNVPYWTPENPGNKWARVESYSNGFNVWENASFVRIDNVSLSYNVPRSLLNKFKIVSCRLSVVSDNPFVWAPHWSWMDPEYDYYTPSYISFKINLTL